MYLIVDYIKKNFKRRWRITTSDSPATVGHSKRAQIRLDVQHEGIEGALEFKDHQWTFTYLTKAPTEISNRQVVIHGDTILPLKEGELRIHPVIKNVHLFQSKSQEHATLPSTDLVWLVWGRNDKTWFSEFKKNSNPIVWPHNSERLNLSPTHEWQTCEKDGFTLRYKWGSLSDVAGFKQGVWSGLLDNQLRPYLTTAFVFCLAIGGLGFWGKNEQDSQKKVVAVLKESTVIRLEAKPVVAAPKNAVARALAQVTAPQSNVKPQRRSLGQMFQQISKRSMASLNTGGAKTISIPDSGAPPSPSSSAKTFKMLGSLGSGTGLGPSQFTKGLSKGGDNTLGGPIGGSNLGAMNQGNVGHGDLGLLHKESEVSGGLEKDVIAKYIDTQKGKILYCYERQLSANPGLFGKVSVKFLISPAGTIETSSILESTLGSKSVESCLLQLIGQWQFPKPKGGVKVLVNYPFMFKSLN